MFMHFLKKHVMAVVRFMPISEKDSSVSAFKSSSMRMESVDAIEVNPVCVKKMCMLYGKSYALSMWNVEFLISNGEWK